METEILLIDDDPVINFLHTRLLRSKFPEVPVKTLLNGLSGLEYIKSKPNSRFLIFLDINMPVMNGWEFLEALSSENDRYNAEIFILTSSIDERDKVKARESEQVTSYLSKPLKLDHLEGVVQIFRGT